MKFAVEFFGLVLFVYLIFIVLAQKTKLRIVNGNKSVSGSTSGLTQISFAGIFDGGEGGEFLDDAFVPIPLGGSGMVFNFFGTNYSTSISWNTNNALVFGTSFDTSIVSVSGVTGKAILLGNYDRICKSLHYSNTIKSAYSFTTILVTFSDYFTDNTSTYKYQIRLIKEKVGSLRQFVEVCIVTSPPSPGYSSNASVSYPSGTQEYPASSGLFVAQDSAGFRIDTTKQSPYNITNGSSFLNTCGSTFATSSPPAGSSFVLSSDSTGSTWTFTNNCYVNVV